MTPRRVLIRLPNWLGDIVMAVPALRAVSEAWPQATVAVALPDGFAPLAGILPGVRQVLPLHARSWRERAATAADIAELEAAGFDAAILFTNSFASARVIARAGIPERWGYGGQFRNLFLTRAIAKPRQREGVARHQSRYYGRLVEALGCPVRSYDVAIEVPSSWRERGGAVLAERLPAAGRPLVGFAPGAAYGTAKRWPCERVAQVVERIARAGGACVLVGSGADASATAAVRDAVTASLGTHAPVVDLAGGTDLPTLTGVIAHCRAFVSNDSGAMHLAAAIGVPVTGLFGPTNEHETSPLGPHTLIIGPAWCRPCMLRHCPIDHHCMRNITADQVFATIQDALHIQ